MNQANPENNDQEMEPEGQSGQSLNFVQAIIAQDNESGKYDGRVHTRFPPEPNGYLHIGHAKSICLNFGMAVENQGLCNLRFDDTNPAKEDVEYVDSIQDDVRWLGFDWEDRIFFASDYYEQLYGYAVQLIKLGKAYVCSLAAEEVREYRGGWNEPGKDSPYRERAVDENLQMFEQMRNGEFADGEHTLRAKIDMASPNMNMRDPPIYRIRHATHHRTGDDWCIYPMYDFTHGLSDSIENITHSICTLEFEDHRPLYDWFLEVLDVYRPQQIEFARLNLTHTVMSKRRLLELVQEGLVQGWDDPRMPTLAGMRRLGYPPEAIRSFCAGIGVAKRENLIQVARLEFEVRDHLNRVAERRMAVLRPLKVVIENYPEDQTDQLDAVNNPNDEAAGSRVVPFSREIYIERDDYMDDAPKKFFRLTLGREVRLRYAFFITCTDVIKDDDGEVIELRCTYDPETRGGDAPDGRKVKGTLHWVAAATAVPAEIRLYDTLLDLEDPSTLEEGKSFIDHVRPDSLETLSGCLVEPSLGGAMAGNSFQFERQGYFCVDPDSAPDRLVFNRTATLRDTWAKQAPKGGKKK
ncbi:MAG: glutamine--tRNA ligase/YqeY domain fusion protein [Pirellulaceae bacterium]